MEGVQNTSVQDRAFQMLQKDPSYAQGIELDKNGKLVDNRSWFQPSFLSGHMSSFEAKFSKNLDTIQTRDKAALEAAEKATLQAAEKEAAEAKANEWTVMGMLTAPIIFVKDSLIAVWGFITKAVDSLLNSFSSEGPSQNEAVVANNEEAAETTEQAEANTAEDANEAANDA